MKIDLSVCRKNTTCKICSMSEWNVPVFIRVHELALREQYDYKALTKWLNTEIEKSNSMAPPADQYPFVTKQQLIMHLTKHIPVDEIARAKASKLTAKPATYEPLDPIVDRKLQDLAAHAAAVGVEELDDFDRYHKTLRQMQKRFDELDAKFDAVDGLPDKDIVMQYKAFGDSVARMLKDSIQMRQQERILQNAIMSTLSTMSIGSLQSILKSIDRAMAEMRPYMTDSPKVESIANVLKQSVGTSLSANTKTALDHLKSVLNVA